MNAEQKVYARLAGDATLTNLLGGRLFPNYPEQDTELPLAVYRRTGTESFPHYGGVAGLHGNEITIEVEAGRFAELQRVMDALIPLLDGTSWPGFQGSFLVDTQFDEEDREHHAFMIFRVFA